ncbi:hypothetical protein LCGC14_0365670 [marine sediment metagenome]|uniref:Uncharacterized protein n=1 Tax=marine sediment metagenome TaxID=412755 RepID=A0A0F9VTY6_9ZZZZ
MLINHPKKYLIGYILLGLWNLAIAMQSYPGWPPTWLSYAVAGLMVPCMVLCVIIIKEGK